MLDITHDDLNAVYGRSAATALATAYESAILTLSLGQWDRIPSRVVRLTLVNAMLIEARLNGFVPERMAEVGLAAVSPSQG